MKQQPYSPIIKEAVHIYYAESSSLLFTKKFQLFYERLLVSSMFYRGKKSDLKTEFKGFKAELPLGQCWELLWKKHFYRLLFEPSHPARWPQRVLTTTCKQAGTPLWRAFLLLLGAHSLRYLGKRTQSHPLLSERNRFYQKMLSLTLTTDFDLGERQ